MIRKLLPVLAVAFLATACFEADLTLDVEEDGSGTFETQLAVDAQRLETLFGGLSASLGEEGEEIDACALLEEPNELADGGTVEPYTKDDLCGFRSVEPFASPEELAEVLDGTFSDDTGVPDVESVTLEQTEEGGWRFELVPPDTGILAEMTPQLAESLGFDQAELTFRLRLPGRVVEHNGDRIEDGFVVWDLDVAELPTEPLQAQSEPGEPVTDDGGSDDDGGGVGPVIVVALIVVVIAGAAFVLLRRRSGTPGADA